MNETITTIIGTVLYWFMLTTLFIITPFSFICLLWQESKSNNK